jgi:integral membrane protein
MVKIFKSVAILEGISYLILFSNMLLIKPISPILYQTLLFPIGMSHGILFIGYIILAFWIKKSQDWDFKIFATVLIASLLPLATFFIEKKIFKKCIVY